MGVTVVDAMGAGVRAVAEMVEEARAAEVKAAVEKAARVVIAAMCQAGTSTCTTNHCIAKGMPCKRAALYCCLQSLLRSIQMRYCHPQQIAPRISGA